ncbi:MAG: adenylate/guanylate cyclase domain-containing protein [Cyclobacteriaceae bacterium]
MNGAQLRHHFMKLLPFPVIWSVAALLYVIVERGILGDATTYPSTGNAYDFNAGLFGRVPGAFLTGILMGLIEISLMRNFLRHKTFLYKVTVKVLLFTLVISGFLILSSLFSSASQMQLPVYHTEVLAATGGFLSNYAFISILIFAGVFNFIAYYISETIDSLGRNIVSNFFTGRYRKPRREFRIFMFLDMKSSTTIAEQLGTITYYEFLKSYYNDMTRAIISTDGEVYQYVGDEIVISWPMKRGLSKLNCIRCFYMIRQELQYKKDYYEAKYGIFPTFKAGIHMGEVTAGEIGVIKREILYTGDVLNTTARIQSLCNEVNEELLISEDLHEKAYRRPGFNYRNMGVFELKGRNEKVSLYSVSQNVHTP